MPTNHIKEVVLHVGLHKTGTSSIQSTLHQKANNKILLQNGILYPRFWPKNHGTVVGSAFYVHREKFRANKFPRILSMEEIEEKDREYLGKLETAINNTEAHTLVISAEVTPLINRKGIENLKKYLIDIGLGHAAFTIMIYTRHPSSWAVSDLQQKIYGSGFRYDRELLKLKENILPTLFQERIGKFIEIFGKEAVNVYSFEDARTHEFGMVGHFLEQLNVDRKVIADLEQKRTNESISMFTGQFVAYLNENMPLMVDGKHNEKRSKPDHKIMKQVKGDKYDIPLEEKRQLDAITRQDREWLEENYDISYPDAEVKEVDFYENLDVSFDDTEKIYPALTKPLRDSLVEFLETELINKIPNSYHDQCMDLIERLKEREEYLEEMDRWEERFQEKLQLDGMDKGIMYRELALLMEGHGLMDAAGLFMEKASLHRPNEKLIQRKLKKYPKAEELKNKNGIPSKKQILSATGLAVGAVTLYNLLGKKEGMDKEETENTR